MLAVIGCGNLTRSDDGIGVRVVQQLREQNQWPHDDWLRLFDAGTAGLEVMFQARGCETLILVDACQGAAEPGAVFAVPGSQLEQAYEPTVNLHDFRWNHALYAGRQIFADAFPATVHVYLVEAASLEFGLELSPPVQQALPKVVDLIQQHIATYAASLRSAADHSSSR